jgi:hypothetical protein
MKGEETIFCKTLLGQKQKAVNGKSNKGKKEETSEERERDWYEARVRDIACSVRSYEQDTSIAVSYYRCDLCTAG